MPGTSSRSSPAMRLLYVKSASEQCAQAPLMLRVTIPFSTPTSATSPPCIWMYGLTLANISSTFFVVLSVFIYFDK